MSQYFKFLKNKYFRFSVVFLLYILWVIWVGNYWLLLGCPIVFDMYITQKVNWAFWKKREGKNPAWVEWVDALIFAVIAVTIINIFLFQNYKIPTGSMEKTLLIGDHLYVSKVAYGPRIPNTPIAFPFAQHTMPGSLYTKSFVRWLEWPYHRLKGLRSVKNDDIVVFNFPEGDTVCIEQQSTSYYNIVRATAEEMQMKDLYSGKAPKTPEQYKNAAREVVLAKYTMTYRPVDRRDNYIKRCVGIAGDTLLIVDGQLFVNGKPQKNYKGKQYHYNIYTNGKVLNPKLFQKMGVYLSDVNQADNSSLVVPLTFENAEKLKQAKNVDSVKIYYEPKGYYNSSVFPHDSRYAWNGDNFGPLWIPKKGVTIPISIDNISIYQRVIEIYEGNKFEMKGNKIFINGIESNTYTFKMDYYFMMGDNRHESADSRYWGFVPEDHIVGRPVFIWLSLNKEASGFFSSIRWDRMFRSADCE
jgi:signal peptidase I